MFWLCTIVGYVRLDDTVYDTNIRGNNLALTDNDINVGRSLSKNWSALKMYIHLLFIHPHTSEVHLAKYIFKVHVSQSFALHFPEKMHFKV